MRPFAIAGASDYWVAATYSVTAAAYTADYNEVKSLGPAVGSTRTADQSEPGRFWLESTVDAWLRFAVQVVAQARHDGLAHARAGADRGLADGCVHRLHRIEILLSPLATDHGDPSRRQRRQSGRRAETPPGFRCAPRQSAARAADAILPGPPASHRVRREHPSAARRTRGAAMNDRPHYTRRAARPGRPLRPRRPAWTPSTRRRSR